VHLLPTLNFRTNRTLKLGRKVVSLTVTVTPDFLSIFNESNIPRAKHLMAATVMSLFGASRYHMLITTCRSPNRNSALCAYKNSEEKYAACLLILYAHGQIGTRIVLHSINRKIP